MMLTCPQKNDAFTVNDTSKGNGALTYGVGLITNDEVILAGGWDSSNYNYYLYNGQDYWTMSPDFYDYRGISNLLVSSTGQAFDCGTVIHDFGVRPVFNLKSEVLTQGTGTASEPYHLAL